MPQTVMSPAASREKVEKARKTPAPKSKQSESSDRSVTDLYMGDIGKIPLLTAEQEVELAAKIRAGDEEARDLMIRSNLRLVVKIAYDYVNFGLPLADLISEGNLGLMKAVERFDPSKGGKLSTYGSWWIKQSIKRALANQSKTIRIPVHVAEKLAVIRKASVRLREEFDREPSDEELAGETNLPLHKLVHLRSVSLQPASLDAPVGEEDDIKLGDLVGDEHAASPAKHLLEKNLREDVRETIEGLDPREAEIIRLRFGLDENGPRTLSEIGEVFGVTRERVRQLQCMALTKIRRTISAMERQATSEEAEDERMEARKIEILREFIKESSSRRHADCRAECMDSNCNCE